ncbi:hypothetical protein ABW19_dt0210163 [Dactylella cylindrospora]|nr:hypothetical protein ABW19_dt0210163 [Dactylella cylindrospora]
MAAEYRFKRPSDQCVFEDAQWNMLCHILETYVPRLTPEETVELKKDYYANVKNPVDEKVLEAFAQESAMDRPEFLEDVDAAFRENVAPDKVAEIKTALNILDTRLGSYVLTGSTTPLYQRSREDREKVVFGWSCARTSALKKLYKALGMITRNFYTRSSPVYHAAAGFPGYPFSKEAEEDLKKTLEAAAAAEANPEYQFEDLNQAPVAGDGVIKLSTSILIIGSGCGGGVVAGHLSKALPHHSMMVVEKGFWYPKHKQPLTERDGLKKLFEESGALQSNDGVVSVLAGSGWGGGSTINWGVSWQLAARTRREWAEKFGLSFVLSPEFQECFDYVSRVGHCKPWKDDEHNSSNSVIIKGSHLRGERYVSVPQNILGDAGMHNKICGAFCTTSCKGAGVDAPEGGGKMSMQKTYLAWARDRGAKFVQGFHVDRLTFDKRGNVTGAEGTWRCSPDEPLGSGKKVIISAKKVICASGTLNTPAILLRSGLKNYWVGRNLHLHPVLVNIAEWEEETRPWEGSIISVANNEHDNLDSDGHGTVIEGMLMLPGFGLISLPWKDALDFKKIILHYKHMTNQVIIARDRDSGRILLDPKTKKPRIEYNPSEHDRGHLMESLIANMNLLRAAGARKIYTPVIGGPIYSRVSDSKEGDQKAFDEAIAKLKKIGLPLDSSAFGSAHQMGTCRMAPSARAGVCNDKGKVFGRKGLYVADAR